MPPSKSAFNTAAALRLVFMPTNLEKATSLRVTKIFVPSLLLHQSQFRSLYDSSRNYNGNGYSNGNNSYSNGRTWPLDRARRDGDGSVGNVGNSYAIKDRRDLLGGNGLPSILDSQVQRGPVDNRRDGFFKRRETRPQSKTPRQMTTKLARLPRNEEIMGRFLIIRDTETGKLSGPMSKEGVISKLDQKSEYIELLTNEDLEAYPDQPRYPICRIVNKREEFEKQKQKQKQNRDKQTSSQKEKEVEMSWGMTEHDMEHKIKQLRRFLAKGYKVQLLIKTKRRLRGGPNIEDAQRIVRQVREVIDDYEGATETRKPEGEMGRRMTLFFAGPPGGVEEDPSASAREEED